MAVPDTTPYPKTLRCELDGQLTTVATPEEWTTWANTHHAEHAARGETLAYMVMPALTLAPMTELDGGFLVYQEDNASAEGEPVAVVARPAGLEQFMELATALYNLPECGTGGPLHVELEDHNTDLLVGEAAARSTAVFQRTLELIAEGYQPVPEETSLRDAPDHPDTEARRYVLWYGKQPRAFRTALALLDITKDWTVDQADAAYAVWALECRGSVCGCDTYPVFEPDPHAPNAEGATA